MQRTTIFMAGKQAGVVGDTKNSQSKLDVLISGLSRAEKDIICSIKPTFPGSHKVLERFNKELAEPAYASNIQSVFSWYTSARLFLVIRFNRILNFMRFVPNGEDISGIGSLSYGLELIYEIYRRIRYKDARQQEGSALRIFNAALWFTVNLVAYLVKKLVSGAIFLFKTPLGNVTTSIIAPFVNLVGFVGDIFIELFRAWKDYKAHKGLLEKIQYLKKCDVPNERTLGHSLEEQINNRIKSIKRNGAYSVVMAVAIVVGMALFYACPPAAIVGSWIALIAGSVINGFCKRIATNIWNYFTGKKPVPQVPTMQSTEIKEEESIDPVVVTVAQLPRPALSHEDKTTADQIYAAQVTSPLPTGTVDEPIAVVGSEGKDTKKILQSIENAEVRENDVVNVQIVLGPGCPDLIAKFNVTLPLSREVVVDIMQGENTKVIPNAEKLEPATTTQSAEAAEAEQLYVLLSPSRH